MRTYICENHKEYVCAYIYTLRDKIKPIKLGDLKIIKELSSNSRTGFKLQSLIQCLMLYH